MTNLLTLYFKLGLLTLSLLILQCNTVANARKVSAGRSQYNPHNLSARREESNNFLPRQKKYTRSRRRSVESDCQVKGAAFLAYASLSSSTAIIYVPPTSTHASTSAFMGAVTSVSYVTSTSTSTATPTAIPIPTSTSTLTITSTATSASEPESVNSQDGAAFVAITFTSIYTSPISSSTSKPPPQSQVAPSSSFSPLPSSLAAASTTSSPTNHVDTTTSGGRVNTGSKFGLAWPNGNYASKSSSDWVGNYIGSKTTWYYTWTSGSVGSADSLGLEYVPMFWGVKRLGDWGIDKKSWPSTVKNALFFNEPNDSSQANISASDAVQYWMNNYLPLRHQGIALGGAGTSNAPSGLQWVKDFQKFCVQDGNAEADCTPSFIPIHWYGTNPTDFQTYVQTFHDETGLDIWVTEYACQDFSGGAQCDESQTWDLHQTMAGWFDSKDYVKRYSPFGVMKDMQGVNPMNALMDPNGAITDLGSWYISSA